MDCSSGFMYGALYYELSQRRKEPLWIEKNGIFGNGEAQTRTVDFLLVRQAL
jgi:hypothetical protein